MSARPPRPIASRYPKRRDAARARARSWSLALGPLGAPAAFALSTVGLGSAPLSRSANAQEVSDLQPPPPEPPAGSQGAAPWTVPGMPSLTLGGASRNGLTASGVPRGEPPNAPPPAQAAPQPAPHGEAVFDPADISGPLTVDDPHALDPANAPEVHRVKKGDTLWDISTTYFRNPWYWPKLWAQNPGITNPHWIYPGDLVRLRPPRDGARAAATAPDDRAAPAGEGFASAPTPERVTLRQTGFVEQGDLKTAARIVGSPEEKELLSTRDEVYVEYEKSHPLEPGQRYSIYHVVSDVRSPGDRKLAGHIVEIAGTLEVKSVGDKRIAKALIREATSPIERKFYVGPLRREYSLSDAVPARKDLDAQVLAQLVPGELIGDQALVFLSRGKDDGVLPGNRFVVVRRGDGVRPMLTTPSSTDARFPREVFGEVQVVDVRKSTSAAVVLRADTEIGIGERVEARKGY